MAKQVYGRILDFSETDYQPIDWSKFSYASETTDSEKALAWISKLFGSMYSSPGEIWQTMTIPFMLDNETFSSDAWVIPDDPVVFTRMSSFIVNNRPGKFDSLTVAGSALPGAATNDTSRLVELSDNGEYKTFGITFSSLDSAPNRFGFAVLSTKTKPSDVFLESSVKLVPVLHIHEIKEELNTTLLLPLAFLVAGEQDYSTTINFPVTQIRSQDLDKNIWIPTRTVNQTIDLIDAIGGKQSLPFTKVVTPASLPASLPTSLPTSLPASLPASLPPDLSTSGTITDVNVKTESVALRSTTIIIIILIAIIVVIFFAALSTFLIVHNGNRRSSGF